MYTERAGVTVSIAQTEEAVAEALAFCGSVYERSYGTHWTVPPDTFFVARQQGEIVATGGLTFAALHPEIASERYFRLTDGMRVFIEANRDRIVEFGRFASTRVIAAKGILHSALSYSALMGIDFIFAWANPTVHHYTSSRLGLNFWPIAVPLDLDNALSDSRWASPPVGFFQREQPPALHLGVVPFWEHASEALARDCGATVPAWQTDVTPPLPALARMKPTSFPRAEPRLLRGKHNINKADQSGVGPVPNFDSFSGTKPLVPGRLQPPQAKK